MLKNIFQKNQKNYACPNITDIGLLELKKIFQVNLNYNFDSIKTLLEGIVALYKETEEEK